MTEGIPLMRFQAALLIVAAWLASSVAVGQSDRVTGFSFLRMDPSARASALAGSYMAVSDGDVNGLYYNPALVREEMSGEISFSYLNHLSDINAAFLTYGRHIEGIASFAAGLRFLSWGSFDRTNEFGERDGTFSAADIALTVGAARPYTDRLRYGASVHMIYSSIDSYRASAVAADVGAAYVVPESDLTASITLNNVGVTVNSFGENRDKLPFDVRASVSKRLRYLPLLLTVTAFDLHNIGDTPDGASGVGSVFHYLNFGGEFRFSPAFQVRIGYSHRKHEALKQKSRLDLAGLGIGAGIVVRNVRVDYSYSSWSSLGGLNQITIGTTL
jgi:hypothetical protein